MYTLYTEWLPAIPSVNVNIGILWNSKTWLRGQYLVQRIIRIVLYRNSVRIIHWFLGGRVFVGGNINPITFNRLRQRKYINWSNWNANKSNTNLLQKHWNPLFLRKSSLLYLCRVCIPQCYKGFVLYSEGNMFRITNFILATHQILFAQTLPMYSTLSLTWKTIVNVLFFLLLSIYSRDQNERGS